MHQRLLLCLLTYILANSICLPSYLHTHRLWLLCNAATETNPELSHSEADEEAAAVSSLTSDDSLRLSSCSVLPEPTNTRRKLMTDTDHWFIPG